MNAIILAAGLGSRLHPHTIDRPKSMLEFGGQTLLGRLIKTFQDSGINDITVVTGYKSEKINLPNVNYVKNKFFRETSTLESLICAKEKINDSTIISYSDIIFQNNILKKLIETEHEISIVVDKQWLKYWKKRTTESVTDATESVCFNKEGFLSSIGQPIKNLDNANGHFIGLMKTQGNGSKIFLKFIEKQINERKKSLQLDPKLDLNKLRIVDALQDLTISGEKIETILINNGWLEFDTTSDLELYNNMKDNNTLSQFIALD